MSDLFDYTFCYLITLFLAVLKITHFIDWSWWMVAIPTIVALVMHFIVTLSQRY